MPCTCKGLLVILDLLALYVFLIGPSFTLLYIFDKVSFLVIHFLALLNLLWFLTGILIFFGLAEINGAFLTIGNNRVTRVQARDRPETPPPSYEDLLSTGQITSPCSETLSQARRGRPRLVIDRGTREESSVPPVR